MADGSTTTSSGSTFTITIDDTSPTIAYHPFSDTLGTPDITQGWNSYYSTSGFFSGLPQGEVGNGTSLHVTAADGASLAIRWNGTGISLYGFFPVSSPYYPASISYTITLDGTPTTNYASTPLSTSDYENSVLASFTNLSYGEHTVILAMRNPQHIANEAMMLEFDRAVIISETPQPRTANISRSVITHTLPDDSVAYRGQWSYDSDILPGQNIAFHTSGKVGDRASLTFNGTAITLSGLTTPLSGSYNVTVDDEAPATFSAHSSFNASQPTVLFQRTGLDPSVSHRVEIVNAGALYAQEGTLLVFGSVNTTSVSEVSGAIPVAGMSSSGLSSGAIAAIAVAVSVGFIALVGLVFYLYRRKNTTRRKRGFLVNPRVNLRRLSFLSRGSLSGSRNKEKDAEGRARESFPGHRRKEEDEESQECGEDGRLRYYDTVSRHQSAHSPQTSPNEDGSYSIRLPEFTAEGHPYALAAYSQLSAPIQTISSVSSDPPPPPQMIRTAALTLPPSSKPRGPRNMRFSPQHTTRESQSVLLKGMQNQIPSDGLQEATSPTTQSPEASTPPKMSPISPTRVTFQDDVPPSARTTGERDKKHRSGASGISLPVSLVQVLGRGNDRPPPDKAPSKHLMPEPSTSRDHRYSFLDMESTRSNSISGHSQSTRRSQPPSASDSSRSRHQGGASEHSIPGGSAFGHGRDDGAPLGLSMTMQGGPTSSEPSRSPEISLQAVSLPPLSAIPSHVPDTTDVPSSAHPRDLSEVLPSPTDSIPYTMSDIDFRRVSRSTASGTDSRRASAQQRVSGSHRGSHPPLPSSALAPTEERHSYLVQRLMGVPTETGLSSPFVTSSGGGTHV